MVIKSSSKSICLRDENWKAIEEIVKKSRGSFRSRSHVIEHLLSTDQSLAQLRDEVLKENAQD